MPDTFTYCKYCATKNRIAATVGGKKVRCGHCKNPLATPAVLERLTKVRNELDRLDREFSRFAGPSRQAAFESALRKQESILRNLPVFPGYDWTVQASLDLYIEIEFKIIGLRRKLNSAIFEVAKQILNRLIDIVTRNRGPAELLMKSHSNGF